MIYVREDTAGEIIELVGNPVIPSLDEERQAPLQTLLAETWSEAERASFGVFAVEPAEVTAGHRIIGYGFERVGDAIVQVLETTPFGPADWKQRIDARLAEEFGKGFAPSHPAFAGERLQVRNGEDRTNWLTSQAAYSAAVAAGQGAVLDAAFRTMANNTIVVSYADGLATLLEMAAWGKALMANSWALKDAAEAGELIDLEAGWP